MATGKTKTLWFCSNCGNESAKWMGRCPSCGEWNTMVEQPAGPSTGKKVLSASIPGEGRSPMALSAVEAVGEDRISLGSAEVDRILGGGIVKGSLVLIGGEPGIV